MAQSFWGKKLAAAPPIPVREKVEEIKEEVLEVVPPGSSSAWPRVEESYIHLSDIAEYKIQEESPQMADAASSMIDADEIAARITELFDGTAPEIIEDAKGNLVYAFPDEITSRLKESFIFLTGKAGTGKSTLLRLEDEKDSHYIEKGSTTGIAAINCGGKTVHSILKYYNTESLEKSFNFGKLHNRLRLVRSRKRVLGIDEVSMLDARQLDLIVSAIADIAEDPMDDFSLRMGATWDLGLHLIGDFCLANGTRIMKADGSLANVENIEIGDELMGPDSKPRKVLRTFSGEANLFKVEQTNGDDYVTTGEHIIHLKRSIDGSRLEEGWKRYPDIPDVYGIRTKDLMNKSRKFRECFVGYKAGVIQFQNQDITIHPYFLGLWLGDGDSDAPRITTMDEEVMEFCWNYAEQLGLSLTINDQHGSKAKRLHLSKGSRGLGNNVLLYMLRELNLINNKHIPNKYMYNMEIRRLQLLAGLLDSDGCWHGNRYTISASNKIFAEQIKQLADQLGFRASLYFNKEGIWSKSKMCYNYDSWTVSIGGDTWRIPCCVARKKSVFRELKRSRLSSVLTIHPTGVGKFSGFELDGDRLFLLADGTVTHNCQLPPVKADFAFKANCWDAIFAENMIRLEKIWRQDNEDFVSAINAMREGHGQEAVRLLKRCGVAFEKTLNDNFDGTTLIPNNLDVDSFNKKKLDKVDSKLIRIQPIRRGQQAKEWDRTEKKTPRGIIIEWGIPFEQRFKEGAYVMCLRNDHKNFTYVNGDCGTIERWNPTSRTFDVRLVRTGKIVTIGMVVQYNYQDEQPSEGQFNSMFYPYEDTLTGQWVIGSIEWMPLRLAWASTIHKSQGLSLDKVQIDSRPQFYGYPSMAYVAVSRGRTPENLIIIGSEHDFANKVKTNKEVLKWV